MYGWSKWNVPLGKMACDTFFCVTAAVTDLQYFLRGGNEEKMRRRADVPAPTTITYTHQSAHKL